MSMSTTATAIEPQEAATRPPRCGWCDEVVLDGEQSAGFLEPMHEECGFRQAVGSVAHILRRCHCYKMGSTLSDPPNLTKREAARAALKLFQQIAEWYGSGFEL